MDDASLVRVLRALADPKRFRMVRELAEAGELCCGELGQRFAVSQPTVSHHLKLLAEAGVLRVRHDGQHHFISVNRELVDEVAALLPARVRAERRGVSGRGRSGVRGTRGRVGGTPHVRIPKQ